MKNKDWKEVKLKDISSKIGSGATPKGGNESYKESGISLIRSMNVYDFEFDFSGLAFIDEEQAKKLDGVRVLEKDILLNITGASVGRCTIVPKEILPARVNQHVSIIRIDTEKADPYFILNLINAPFYKNRLLSISSDGATREALTKSDIEDFQLSLPPLPVQQKIADTLGAYDELIENNRRRMALLENMAAGLYKEWFVRMRFHGQTLPINPETGLPEGWEEIRFSDFIKLNRGFDLPDEKMEEGIYPVIASTGIKGFHSSFKVKGPCVTTGRSGSLGTVIYDDRDSWPLNTSLYVKDFKGNSPIFVYYTLKELNLETFNSGAGVPTLNQNHLHNLKLPLPKKELQNEFEEIAINIFTQIKTLQEQTGVLRRMRDRLLPRLMSGELGE